MVARFALGATGYSAADIPALVEGTLPQHRVIKLSSRPAFRRRHVGVINHWSLRDNRSMKKLIPMLFAFVLCAQETRREIVNAAAKPADDAKANSDQVPDVYALNGRFDRVVILRFKYDTDLLAGIEKMVKQEKIKNAVILSGAGSVRGYHVHQVSNRDFPSKNIFVQDPTAPADVISMNGYIIDGRIHAHMTLANPDRAFGGHLEPGSRVFTFAIVTLGVLDAGVDLSKVDDKTYR